MRKFIPSVYVVLGTAMVLFVTAPAAWAVQVTSFGPATSSPTYGSWYRNGVEANGTASIVDLFGAGGALENSQPLPIGAALLTTGASNDDRAQVGVADDYGTASTILTDGSFSLGYSFYKGSAGDLNIWAAPSIKLTLYNPSAVGDGYGMLVYEPYWQQSPLVPPTTGDWVSVAISSTSGLFWWDGGFGNPNSFGGPPLKTLSEWSGVFDSDFVGASLAEVSVGVGTYNQGQTGYFDNVSISFTGYSATYDFEPIPEPSTALLVLLGLVGLAYRRRA